MKINNRQLQSTVLLTLCLMALLLGGCGGRGGQEPPEEVAVTAMPTATAVTVSEVPTFTPTSVPDTPTPVPTNTPLPPPTAVPTVEDKRATVNSQYGANLRAGPGMTYARVGILEQGEKVTAIAQTRDGQWIELENGWVFHNLLDGIPADLPLPRSIPSPPTPTPLPPTATATPAPSTPTLVPTPTPRLGDFDNPFHMDEGSGDHMSDLVIKITKVIYENENEILKYIERAIGQSCRGCLVLELEIRNSNGNPKEYMVQEDFKLLKGDSKADPFPQVICSKSSDRLTSQNIYLGLDSLRNIWRIDYDNDPDSDPKTAALCFTGIEDSAKDIRDHYRLVYKHSWKSPTPTPNPTLTDKGEQPKWNEDGRERPYYFELSTLN